MNVISNKDSLKELSQLLKKPSLRLVFRKLSTSLTGKKIPVHIGNDTGAYTDYKIIKLGLKDSVDKFADMLLDKTDWMTMYRALLIHESAHIIYSKAGEKKKIADEVSLKYKSTSLGSLASSFWNIVEDGRIERLMAIMSEIMGDDLKLLNYRLFADGNEEVEFKKNYLDSMSNPDFRPDHVRSLSNYMMFKACEQKMDGFWTDRFKESPFFAKKDELDEILDKIFWANNYQMATLGTYEIVELYKDELLAELKDMQDLQDLMDALDQFKGYTPEQGEGRSFDGDIQGSTVYIQAHQNSNQMDKNEDEENKESSGKGNSNEKDSDEEKSGNGGSDEKDSDEENSNEGSSGKDDSDEKDSGDENADDNESKNNQSKNSQMENNQSSLSRNLYQNNDDSDITAEERLKEALSRSRENSQHQIEQAEKPDEVKDDSDDGASLIPKDYEDYDFDSVDATSESKRSYTQNEIDQSKQLTKCFRKILKDDIAYNNKRKLSGNLDKKALVRFVGRKDRDVFERRKKNNDRQNIAAYILFDLSGSTSSATNNGRMVYENSIIAANVIQKAVGTLFPLKVAGFSAYRGVQHIVYKRFGDNPRKAIDESFDWCGGGNFDTMSLTIAAEELKKRPEKNKILFIMTDGEPSVGDNSNLTEVVKKYRKEGVEVISFALDMSAYSAKRIDQLYDGSLSCESSELASILSKLLTKKFKGTK